MSSYICITILNCQYINEISTVFSPNEGVMLLVQLDPARLGNLSYYLPVLLLDNADDDDDGGGTIAAAAPLELH